MMGFPRVFVVKAGGDTEEKYSLDHGIAIVDWDMYPSLEGMESLEDFKRIVFQEDEGLKHGMVERVARQLYTFVTQMEVGDVVVMPMSQRSYVALGRVRGDYYYNESLFDYLHAREVDWIRPVVPRSSFQSNLLCLIDSPIVVCEISGSAASRQVFAAMYGDFDPGISNSKNCNLCVAPSVEGGSTQMHDCLAKLHHYINDMIRSRGPSSIGRIVDAVLQADGWITKVILEDQDRPEKEVNGPDIPFPSFLSGQTDGKLDIMAGRGRLGLLPPYLYVHVDSSNDVADEAALRRVCASVVSSGASQGLFVCWGGFTKAAEDVQRFFHVRIWGNLDLVEAVYRNYERLPAEMQVEFLIEKTTMPNMKVSKE